MSAPCPLPQELEDSSLIAPPPPEPTSAQKLASLAVFSDLLVGFLFSLGLGVSGMARPSKVAAFLSVTAGAQPASPLPVQLLLSRCLCEAAI